MQDFDTGTNYRLNIGQGLSIPTNSEQIGTSYDAANNRLLVVLTNGTTVTYFSIGLPSDLTNAAAYTVVERTVSFSDGSMSAANLAHFYGKTNIHPTLGVVLVPANQQRMMAFRPSV